MHCAERCTGGEFGIASFAATIVELRKEKTGLRNYSCVLVLHVASCQKSTYKKLRSEDEKHRCTSYSEIPHKFRHSASSFEKGDQTIITSNEGLQAQRP